MIGYLLKVGQSAQVFINMALIQEPHIHHKVSSAFILSYFITFTALFPRTFSSVNVQPVLLLSGKTDCRGNT